MLMIIIHFIGFAPYWDHISSKIIKKYFTVKVQYKFMIFIVSLPIIIIIKTDMFIYKTEKKKKIKDERQFNIALLLVVWLREKITPPARDYNIDSNPIVCYCKQNKRSLTYYRQVVPEALGGWISEIHTTSIHSFIFPLHFVHKQTRWIGKCPERSTISEHFRRWIMVCVIQWHTSYVKTVNTQ